MKRLAFIIFVFVLGFAAGAYFATHRADSSGVSRTVEGSGVSYSSLSLDRDQVGWFRGTVRIRNESNVEVTVYVTVNVFDGEENVGRLTGDVAVKPHTSSGVQLTSADEYRSFTDTSVELLPIP